MRLMACFARNAVGVIRWINLRKAFGLGGTRRMASRTKNSGIRLYRCHRGRIVGVFGQRSVARFAAHVHVSAFALHIEDIGMAGLASLVTGELNGSSRDFAECSTAIVPILPKARWNHVMSNDKKDDEGENEESRETE
jgi:hypothetical protein